MTPDLLLHETPIIRAFFKRIRCLLKGGHNHVFVDHALTEDKDGNTHYTTYYVCKHCRHLKWVNS